MTHTPPDPPPSPALTADQRVSTLVGDRLCVTCGFNLTSQTVVREPHYRMLIVRCPECATIASLQEFPLLGRWAARWGALLAALWLLVMILFTLGTAGAIFGISLGVSREACGPVARLISTEYSNFTKAQQEAEAAAAEESRKAQNDAQIAAQQSAQQTIQSIIALQADGQTLTVDQQAALEGSILAVQQSTQAIAISSAQQWQGYYGDGWIDDAWWQQQDHAAFLASAGSRTLAPDTVRLWLVLALVAFILGLVWGVALLHGHAKRRAIVCLIVLAPISLFWVIASSTQSSNWGPAGTFYYAPELARNLAGTSPFVASVLLALIPLFLGMTAGRPLARLLIRLLLPPRLRGPLTTLWLTDGLPPPATH